VRIPVTHKIQTKTPPGQRKNTSMYSLNQVKTLASCGRDPARSLPLWRGFLLIPLILACFAFSPQSQAACLDGCDNSLFNTFQGDDTLLNNAGVAGNSAFGWRSLFFNSTGSFNTALGPSLIINTIGSNNTAAGAAALLLNSTGTENTAMGVDAMVFNSTGEFNGAFGGFALFNNVDGFSNNAFGDSALFFNITGADNTAVGDLALENNDSSGAGSANFNTAVGAQALFANVDGDSNNAVGFNALGANVDGLFNQAMGALALSANTSGASNIAVGDSALVNKGSGSFNTVVGDGAGGDLADGSDNIYIGATAGAGATSESGTIRIGDPDFVSACFVRGISGNTVSGSPVCVGGDGQLGECAAGGSPGAMNQLLKEQATKIASPESQIHNLTAALKQQAEQIQKVSAQLEMVRPAPRVVNNQ